jgi:diaminohydroxyphosphoribosylaminopyrimidine deaminase/5-amino-6-(5-phosphoribosylamino)uracil reductase
LTEQTGLDRAFELAQKGPKYGPNPRVGCVIIGADGALAGEGYHNGAGTPHAEAAALDDAERRGIVPEGATAYLTLEPCNHCGRTGPCSQLLANAGIKRVVYALSDPNPVAKGGAGYLAERGVELVSDVDPERAIELNRAWFVAVSRGWPYVTLKLASTVDGRVAAADGSSRWITGSAARGHAHAKRAEVDAIVVGSGTFWTDRPQLTARRQDGSLYEHQPLRVIIGRRPLDLPQTQSYQQIATHQPARALKILADQEVRHVLLEGGPTLSAAFLRCGLVDQIDLYIAPALLGAGPPSVGDLGIESIDQALRWRTSRVELLGDDLFVELGR